MTVTVAARDAGGLIAQQSFPVTVPNRPPEATADIPDQTVFAGQTATVDASAWFRDPDGDGLRYAAMSSRAAVAAVAVSGVEIAIRALAPGVTRIAVRASDADGAGVEQAFQVTVPNRAPDPVGTITPLTLPTGETATVDVSGYFVDLDGEKLSFAAATSNAAVAVVSVVGDSVAVTATGRGLATITITARDPQGEAAQQSFRVTVPNRAPQPVGTIPPLALPSAGTATVDVSSYFTDPDGDALSHSAISSNAGVAAVSVSSGVVTVRALSPGDVTVTVTASDPGGLTASSAFDVSVASAPGFQIELVFATPVTRTQEAAFVRAAQRWMAVLAPSDLPDVALNRTVGCDGDPRFERSVATIDDLMIVVAVTEIDGRRGVLGRAKPCWIRTGTSLPLYGGIELDAADLNRLETGDLEDLILHEMGHVLGIGTLWDRLGLLRNPASKDDQRDTHFTGRMAIAAFDEAGGANYAGAKVPVENTGGPGTWNGHWREGVLTTELMTGQLDRGPEPLSAITVQSLADLGYSVDPAAADPYRLPDADAARAVEEDEGIPYGDDIWRGPIVVVDEAGRIVRVIQRH
ncbi:MAG: hypothetical protein OXI39_08560 [Gemmatimonadota bacterium]|uniref:leishmanolysin-related zinc metalloendopeptidase n=1 Tax=Candidatus Palauibacter scopulicola TaxID=3056741 RepID=UPI00239961C3|nr:leishmanolysin-related zinc metalloendopeptidase [Candidatus Palauibacter scopulicola]MDE2663040.1 hypothetical protein [Candidatus Palauibacter scopulicola]